MNHLTDGQYTAYIGIDWADTKHDICLQAANTNQLEFDCIPHQVDDIEQWALSLYQRFGGPIAIALELAHGPIVYALQKYDFLVLFPINPSTLAKYREAFTPSRAKDDPTDAELALDLLLRHPDRFQPLAPQSVELRALATLVEQRRGLVNDRVRITNRLRNTLKQYYPQVLEWFDRSATSSPAGPPWNRSSGHARVRWNGSFVSTACAAHRSSRNATRQSRLRHR